jgi:hypothetical protein
MLYKFKSQSTGDLIMLEANGRQMLKIIGKGDDANLAKGILEPGDIPAAIEALVKAVQADDQARAVAQAQAEADHEETAPVTSVSLRQRAAPLLDIMQRCLAEDTPIVWGV